VTEKYHLSQPGRSP